MTKQIGDELLASTIAQLESYKSLAERAVVQVNDIDVHQPLRSDRNSIAIIMKHLAGNMLSRWTDLLTTDGEKSNRNRDSEFIDEFQSREELMEYWEKGWKCLLNTLHSLKSDDLVKEITIRGEAHSVTETIQRQMLHYGYHIGQIILIARIRVGESAWQTLTIPIGGSDEFNRKSGYDPTE